MTGPRRPAHRPTHRLSRHRGTERQHSKEYRP